MPTGKLSETTSFLNKLCAWTKNEMIGISKDGLRTKLVHFFHGESFDGGTRGGTNKSRGLNIAVRSMNDTDTSEAIFMLYFKL